MRERERVRSGSGGHEERRHLMLEEFRQAPFRALGQRIVAIAHGKAFVRTRERLQELRRDSGGIVAGEIHAETAFNSAKCEGRARIDGDRCTDNESI
jgi:hypothetical protein